MNQTEVDSPIVPQMIGVLGLKSPPKRKWWKPEWVRRRQKENQDIEVMSQWTPIIHEPTEAEMNQALAQDLRDWGEMLVGYCDIDPEKSSIGRRRPPGTNSLRGWMSHLKYEPPKTKEASKRKLMRQSIREANRKMAKAGVKI